MFNSIKDKIDPLRYKAERLRYEWKDMLCADLAARATARFPRVAYWVALTVGVRNIHDDEIVPDVPFMAVLNRQFIKVKGLSYDV